MTEITADTANLTIAQLLSSVWRYAFSTLVWRIGWRSLPNESSQLLINVSRSLWPEKQSSPPSPIIEKVSSVVDVWRCTHKTGSLSAFTGFGPIDQGEPHDIKTISRPAQAGGRVETKEFISSIEIYDDNAMAASLPRTELGRNLAGTFTAVSGVVNA